jgi:hypothetical protein
VRAIQLDGTSQCENLLAYTPRASPAMESSPSNPDAATPAITTSTRELIRFVTWFALLFLISQVPLYAVRYPDISDFPNHLARLYVLQHLDSSPVLRQFYVREPGVTTNSMLDVVGPPLANAIGLEHALKLFASLCTLLLASGTVALNVALTRKLTPLALGSLLFAHNVFTHLGLFNFLFGAGLALWLLALWIGARSHGMSIPLGLTAFALPTLLVYVCHLSSVGVYLLGVFAYEYSLPSDKSKWVQSARAFAVAACLALPALIMHLSTYRPGSNLASAYPAIPLLALAAYKLLLPFLLPGLIYDARVPIVILMMTATVLGVYRGWKHGYIGFSRSGLTIAAVLGIVIGILPPYGLGSRMVDARLVLPLLLVMWASLDYRPVHAAARSPTTLAIAVAAGVVTLAADTTQRWLSSQGEYIQLRHAMQAIQQGSKVAVTILSMEDFGPSPHAAAWVVIDRSVFLSSFYLRPFQPFMLGYRPELVALAKRSRQDDQGPPASLAGLQGHYDYVIAFGHEPALSLYAGRANVMYRSPRAMLVELR